MANISQPIVQPFQTPEPGATGQPIQAANEQASSEIFDNPAHIASPESPGKDRARGSVEKSIGSTKEALGGLVHSNKLAEKGAEQYRAGLRQEQVGARRDDREGVTSSIDRGVKGVIDKITPDNLDKDVVHIEDQISDGEDVA